MSQNEALSRRWENYRPSKALWFWSVAGAVVATMVIGFTAGGWTTAGSAADQAAQAARDARIELASTVCVEKFAAEADAATRLAELKKASSWQRDEFIDEGGWAILVGMEKAVPGAADACADQLAAMDSLPVRDVEMAPASTDG